MYAAIRIAAAVPTLLGVSVFAFLMVHLAPGDPLTAMTGGLAPQSVVQQFAAFYGFDRPLPEQYLHWLSNVLRGDLGVSVSSGRSVGPELLAAFENSLKFVLLAAPLATGIGWAIGSYAAWNPRTVPGRALMVLLGTFVSVPQYWLGMVLVAIFGVSLHWLPVMGMGPASNWSGWLTPEGLTFLILPVATLLIGPVGILGRSTRTAIEAVIASDLPEALRARGMSERYVRARVARNALPGLLPLYGLQVSYMFGGLVMIEAIFALPGFGNFLILAITSRDMPSIQAGILVSSSIFVLLNLLADLLQHGLDRRAAR
jgi:peptide/nickel transport system permease protein